MDKITLTESQFEKWMYDTKSDDSWQSLVDLTREPKKLYAVREIETGVIIFYDRNLILIKDNSGSQTKYERVPEYDITYPIGEK
jgi:hypothetical protein